MTDPDFSNLTPKQEYVLGQCWDWTEHKISDGMPSCRILNNFQQTTKHSRSINAVLGLLNTKGHLKKTSYKPPAQTKPGDKFCVNYFAIKNKDYNFLYESFFQKFEDKDYVDTFLSSMDETEAASFIDEAAAFNSLADNVIAVVGPSFNIGYNKPPGDPGASASPLFNWSKSVSGTLEVEQSGYKHFTQEYPASADKPFITSAMKEKEMIQPFKHKIEAKQFAFNPSNHMKNTLDAFQQAKQKGWHAQ